MMKKKYTLITFCMCLFLLCAVLPAQAQQAGTTVQGTVVDVKGKPVAGATIVVYIGEVPSSRGSTISDGSGKFNVTVPQGGKFQVSFLGFQTQMVTSLAATQRIILQDEITELDAAVSFGFRSDKLRNATGAVATINPEELKDFLVGDLSTSLQGLVPGLDVYRQGNRPGDASTIVIRNADAQYFNSRYSTGDAIQQVTTPLYVIDEFEASESAFNALNPNEIETITVLKDASAAVYGVNGARGVILVTTKRGKTGEAKISYQGQFGYSNALKHPELLSAYDYGRIYDASIRAADRVEGGTIDYFNSMFSASELELMKGMDYNLLDKYWKAAGTMQHSIGLSGGTQNASFNTNISYYTADGNIGRLDYNRWNFRSGLNARLGKYVRVSMNVSGNYETKNSSYNWVGGSNDSEADYRIMLLNPYYIPDYVGDNIPVVRNGITNVSSTSSNQNYNFDVLQKSENYRSTMPSSLSINLSLEYNFGWIPALTGLTTKLQYSKGLSTSKTNTSVGDFIVYRMMDRVNGEGVSSPEGHLYTGPGANYDKSNFEKLNLSGGGGVAGGDGGSISRSMSRGDNYQLQWTTNYARSFKLHNVGANFTIRRSESESEDLSGSRKKPRPWSNGQYGSAFGDFSTNWSRNEAGTLSYVAQATYSYDSKYLFDATLRIDASTKFHPDNYWGYFPSFGLGWVISEEDWMKSRTNSVFNFLKLRATFGLMGSDNIKPWTWKDSYLMSGGTAFGTDPGALTTQGLAIAYGDSRTGDSKNPNAHWDKSYKLNVGLDARLFRGNLSLGVDGYYNWGRDMFVYFTNTPNFSGIVGTKAAPENYGAIDNWGVEFSAGWKGKIGTGFTYNVKGNTSWGTNKIIKAPVPTGGLYELGEKMIGEDTYEGQWGADCLGIFRSYQEIAEYFDKYCISNYFGKTQADIHPGMLIYRDVRGAQPGGSGAADLVLANPEKYDHWGYAKDPDGIINGNDIVKINNRSANYMKFNLNFNGSYRNVWSFSGQMTFSWGGYEFMPSNARGISMSAFQVTNIPSFWNDMFVYEDVYDGYGNLVMKANPNGAWPNLRFSDINSKQSTFWEISGFQAMLRNLTFAYTVPDRIVDYVGVSSCRFNLTIQNVLNFTNPYPKNFMSGYEGAGYGSYPLQRTLSLGINVSF